MTLDWTRAKDICGTTAAAAIGISPPLIQPWLVPIHTQILPRNIQCANLPALVGTGNSLAVPSLWLPLQQLKAFADIKQVPTAEGQCWNGQ